jgi:hypothetical protein
MSEIPWSDEEYDLIVDDYFAMFMKYIARLPYERAEHNRQLKTKIRRSEKSIEFKHQNISAVLKGLGEDWLPGYEPVFSNESTLVDAVIRGLERHRSWLDSNANGHSVDGLRESPTLWVGPPPAQSSQRPPEEREQMLQIARKFDVAGRDACNRILGRAGEECVLVHEQAVLTNAGRNDLAHKVLLVAENDGDGLGYDIASFALDGRPRLIKVKTTNGGERTPFRITSNELAVAEQRGREWCLFRLWNFSREPKAFELHPPLKAYVSLTAMTFQADFA